MKKYTNVWRSFFPSLYVKEWDYLISNLCANARMHSATMCKYLRTTFQESTVNFFELLAKLKCRPVVPGCAGCADFARSVNPISTRGDRLCPPNYYWHPQIFRPSDGPDYSYYLSQTHIFQNDTEWLEIFFKGYLLSFG